MQATTKTKTNEGIKIGDVFHSGHGWNGSMTHKFYMVTALNGRTQATLSESRRPLRLVAMRKTRHLLSGGDGKRPR